MQEHYAATAGRCPVCDTVLDTASDVVDRFQKWERATRYIVDCGNCEERLTLDIFHNLLLSAGVEVSVTPQQSTAHL